MLKHLFPRSSLQIDTVFAISNERLLTSFTNYRLALEGKQRANPQFFRSEDWKTLKLATKRKEYQEHLRGYSISYEWNGTKIPDIVAMIQGTAEGAAWQIAQQGFGTVGTTDDGYYGSGMYFTNSLFYARNYAKPSEQGFPYILALVIPGNAFPVTERPGEEGNYCGKALRKGYQSHFTIVDSGEFPEAYPVLGSLKGHQYLAYELVTFEGSQALPLFVFYGK